MTTIFRKVSVRERLPQKEDNYFVFIVGRETDDENFTTTEYTMGRYSHFVRTFQGEIFTLIPENESVTHWLEEVELLNDEKLNEEHKFKNHNFYQGAKWMRDFVLAVAPLTSNTNSH